MFFKMSFLNHKLYSNFKCASDAEGFISFYRFWASPIEDDGSLCYGARYSLGLVTVSLISNGTVTRLPPYVVTHSTALMQFISKKSPFEIQPFHLCVDGVVRF